MSQQIGHVTVSLDRAHLAARLKRGKDTAGKALAEQIIGDSIPYTPNDGEGILQASARPEKIGDDWCATWNTVYAAYQWYGCWEDGSHVIKNHTTMPNVKATTQWVEAAKAEYGEKWGVVADREHKKGAGG